jgi:hypothetical protein
LGVVPLALSPRTHELRTNETLVYAFEGGVWRPAFKVFVHQIPATRDAIKDGFVLDEDPIQ